MIQSIWLSPRLTTMARLCIRSFLAHGHEFHLYTYGSVDNVPDGTIIRDGREIMPAIDSRFPSYVCFSDLFRYELLWQRGGWAIDMDLVCLKPFDFEDDFLFAGEYNAEPPLVRATLGVMKASVGHSVMEAMVKEFWRFDLSKWNWTETGPDLVTRVIQWNNLERFVKPPSVFMPIPHTRVPELVLPDRDLPTAWNLDNAYSIHLWCNGWTVRGMDVDAEYPPGCLYEKIKTKYL